MLPNQFLTLISTLLDVFSQLATCQPTPGPFNTSYFNTDGVFVQSVHNRNGIHIFFHPQTLLAYNFHSAIGIMIGISVLSSLAALLLPIETRGRPLKVCTCKLYVYMPPHFYHPRILEDNCTVK